MKAFIFCLAACSAAGSLAVFTDQPRLQTVDGHLFIYGGSDKNLTFMTTKRGYINVNGENLYGIVQDAKMASQLIKSLKYSSLSKLEEEMKMVAVTLDTYSQRLNVCESILTSKPKDKNVYPLVSTLSSRLTKLERKVRTISRNLRRNECRRDPCLNGGTCLDRYLGYECRCPEGWEGKKCEKDVNECAKFAGTDLGCQNGATCYNTRGSYECHCAPGWHGLHCLRRTNDCSSGSSAELCGHGICVTQLNDPRGYTCICYQGWTTDGVSQACTVDVDECAISPCSRSPPVACHNAPGSFFCGPCPTGYTGNGFLCSDVDECSVDNGGCSVQPMVTCINTLGSSACGPCPPGYSGDGKTCVFVGKCQVENGGCHPNARCIEVGTNIQCQCLPGYKGHGIGPFGCEPVSGPVSMNPCIPNPCRFGGRCYPNISETNFTCVCLPGFSGPTCSVANSCDNNPCQNGGTCESRGSTFRCKCPTQFRGTFCEDRKEECGEHLRANEGSLKFPENFMTSVINCAWVIQVNVTKVINITFDHFDLRSSYECQLEWLEIHDGRSTGDVAIGKFCGKTLPNNGTIATSQNYVYIWFKSMQMSTSRFELRWNAADPVCGGGVNASVHGVITSPGYPGKYPNNRDCYWEVMAPIGKRIMFTVFELQLDTTGSCANDFVEIHDGMSLDGPLLAVLCNSTSPGIVETQGNMAFVYFHSDARGTGKGFQMAYHPKPGHPGCGGIFTTLRGEITPPTRNDLYLPNMDCAWIIRLPEDRKIRLEFESFYIQNSRNCRDDFLEVRDGGDITSPLLGKYCGSRAPPPILSNYKTMFIRFYSDQIIETSGFRIRYKSVCDSTYTAPSGVIKSPGYPKTYRNEEECAFIIEQPVGKIINLEFQEFEIESTYRCIFDYVEIRDGHSEDSPLIGRYCGSNRPGRIISTHNYLYMKMVTDDNVELAGFYGNYSTVDVSCGGINTAPSGVINSPTEGDRYPSNTKCKWVIAVKPGELIQLTFTKFKVEGFSNCLFDYVAVYDNSSTVKGNNLIGRYCNSNLPPMVTSAGNVLTIVFSSDSSFTDEGFSATYTAVNGSSTCGGKFFTEWGVIKTPNYPNFYPNGISCTWVISVKNGHKIHLNISDFFIERPFVFGDKKCKFDYLEIRDGGYVSSPLIGRYCGSEIPKKILSQSNNLYLEFVSDNLDSGRGFEIFWDGSVKGCGGTLTGPTGSIISPNYPERYGSVVNCIYHISISHGSKVQINFIDLDLEPSQGCTKEYIEILDGQDVRSKSLGTFCSILSVPPNVLSSGNHVTVKFRSGLGSSGKGFFLKYFTVCRTNVTGYRGAIESPNYPNDFPISLDCLWSIKAPPGNKISLSFTDFNFRSSCRNTFFEVSEGDPSVSVAYKLRKYCKNNKTMAIESSEEWLHLRFVTSDRPIGGNFRLEWVVKGCGGYMTKPVGQFTSPNYPNVYPVGIHCEWWITVDPLKSISLVFSDVSMEKSEDCTFDGIEVYGGPDKGSPLLTRICHSRKEDITVFSSGHQMYVYFHSDSSNVGRGFKAKYFTSESSCGGLFTAQSGTIHSRNYPKNYQTDDCEWFIVVDSNHRVNLTFLTFDLTESDNCSQAYVEVFDGFTTSAPSLWRQCGNNVNQKTIISTRESMVVRMKVSNTTYTAKGFLAAYSMTCGGVVNADSPGVLDGGAFLNNPASIGNCTWLISTSQPDGHVILTLSHMDLGVIDEDDDSCPNEYVQIYDGDNDNDTLIGTYCARFTPLPIVSKGNQVLVKLVKGWSLRAHLNIMYSSASSACGGTLSSLRGLFASPNYPNSYPPNSECVWTIDSAPGNKVQLSFKVFDIGTAQYCNDEYVEIRDHDAKGKLIGVYCGSEPPSNLTAHNALWVKFKSRTGGSGTMRFLADYSLVYGNEINGTSGQIGNPGYPKPFIANAPVTWRVSVDFKKYILIQFKELYLESTGLSECSSSLTIYDGFDDTAPVLVKKCDSDLSEFPMTSSSNIIFIVFMAESTFIGSQFLLEWSETSTRKAVPIVPTSSPIPGCGGEFFLSLQGNTSMLITIPVNKAKPFSNVECTWKISCAEEEHLSLTINSLELRSFGGCEMSYLKASTESGGTWREIFKFCNNVEKNGTYQAHSVLKIEYLHKWSPSESPATFFVRIECGGSIRKTNGIIDFDWRNYSTAQTPVQRSHKQGKYLCQWDIAVTPGRTIRTNIIQLNGLTSNDGICEDNDFSLRNGGTEDSPYLGGGVYCSPNGIIPRTTSNRLFVKAHASYRFYGFTLSYEEVPHECGGRFTLDDQVNSTIISSPNYPNIPPMKVECIWKFVTVGVKRLQIDFLDRFDLASSFGCTVEYVSVRDGGTDLADELGRFCSGKPSTIKTTGNMMYVRYFTNTTDPQNGFRAKVSIDRCGGIITSSSGVITSPGYPNSYPYNTQCSWKIETNSISTIRIHFEDVDLPHHYSTLVYSLNTWLAPRLDALIGPSIERSLLLNGTNCTSTARITVSEPVPYNENPLPLLTVCSNGQTESVQTRENKAIINFDSSAWDVGHYFVTPRGFKLNFTSTKSSCMYEFFTESGVIESPKNPTGYDCEWKITVPRGRRVTVTFDGNYVLRNYAWFLKKVILLAYNDHSYGSLIGTLIPTEGTSNIVVKSTSNLMLISLFSSYIPRYNNFKLFYNSDEPAVCGGNINDTSGFIESPKNFSSYYCPWYFMHKPRDDQTLAITVYDSVIGNRTGTCTTKYGNYLSLVAKGKSVDHHVVVCGNVSSRIIRTPFTRAVLTLLKGRRYFGDMDFRAKYSILPCGGVLTGSDFVITSPNYPDNYPNNMDCAWLVQVPFDSAVKVTFEELSLDAKTVCSDYVTVRNGENLDSPMIDRYCGLLVSSKPIISETDSVLIEFHSDESNTERGFKIKIESVNAVCGGIVHSEDTVITSPHFPLPYGNNEECEWEIRTKEGMHIGLVFQERFHIEESIDCKKDYLEVFDYVNEEWKLLKKVCGREFPAPINSTTNRMKILFHSDETVASDGFKAKWYSNCGATFTNVKSGRIVSPGFPDRYPSDIRCEYIVDYPNMEMEFTFSYFKLEKASQGSCIYDSLEFFKLTWQEEYESEGKFCGSTIPSPVTISRKAKIVFTTDTYINFNGFDLSFHVDTCGGVIAEPTSINFGYGRSNYMSQQECQWNITAPQNKIVVLRFTRINLPISNYCADIAVKITEPNATGSPQQLASLCGFVTENLPTIRSSGRNVTITVGNLYYDSQKGFDVVVSFSYGRNQGCGGTISLGSNPETIQSPDVDRDGKYEELMDCNWLILAKPFHYITANFLEIDVDNCNSTRSNNFAGNCSCDFAELRNGIDPDSEVILTACGNAPPPRVVSSGNAISLRFLTDSSINRKGFAVQFSSALSECGYGFLNVTRSVQTLTSPKYPGKYPLGIRCKWVIVNRGKNLEQETTVMHVHFAEWDLEEGDQLTIRDTGGIAERSIDVTDESDKVGEPAYVVGKGVHFVLSNTFLSGKRVLTGKGKLFDYYAQTNEITIDFVSKGTASKKGFRLEYSIAGCTRNYSSDHGQIVINHGSGKTCELVIEAPTSNHTISLYVYSLRMYYGNTSCPWNYVEVRDGRSSNSPLLRKFCGSDRPKPIYSSGQYIHLKMVTTDESSLYPYTFADILDLTYATTDKGKGCGGRVSAMRGVIFSPEYPNNIRRSAKCRWDISQPGGLDIVLKFKTFDIGPSNTCDTDFLEISDVEADGSLTSRSKFCGSSDPAEIRSRAGGIAVVYERSVHNGGTGWEIEYKVVVPGSEVLW